MDRKKLDDTINILIGVLIIILLTFYLGYAIYAVFFSDKITASAEVLPESVFPNYETLEAGGYDNRVSFMRYSIGATNEYLIPFVIHYDGGMYENSMFVVNISSADLFNTGNFYSHTQPNGSYDRFEFRLPVWDSAGYATHYAIFCLNRFTDFTYGYYWEGYFTYPSTNNETLISTYGVSNVYSTNFDGNPAYTDGYSAGLSAGTSTGFADGYEEGITMGGALGGFFPSIFSAVSDFLIDTLGGMTLFGISAWQVLLTLVSIGLVILIGKIFIK